MRTHVERIPKINIISNLAFLVLLLAITFNGMQGISDYKQRFNYLIGNLPCENCEHVNIKETDLKAAIHIKGDVANMLRQNLNNSQILEKIKDPHSEQALYNSVLGDKSGMFVLNLTLLLGFAVVFIKYLC